MIHKNDYTYLSRCVELAKIALIKGEQPFGAILVSKEGTILFEGHNHVANGDHTQHPEFAIARWSAKYLTPEQRKVATVYTSGEHCPMCAAAHGWVGLGRIVYASSTKQLMAWQQDLGISSGPLYPLAIEEVVREIIIDGPDPILSEQVRQLHYQFYKQ